MATKVRLHLQNSILTHLTSGVDCMCLNLSRNGAWFGMNGRWPTGFGNDHDNVCFRYLLQLQVYHLFDVTRGLSSAPPNSQLSYSSLGISKIPATYGSCKNSENHRPRAIDWMGYVQIVPWTNFTHPQNLKIMTPFLAFCRSSAQFGPLG